MQTCLCTCTQTEHEDAKHYLSGSCQIPSTSDRHPPLSARCSSPTTPRQEPCIRTLAEELEDAKFRTPDSPRGNDPDPGDPDDPDDDGDNNDITSEPSVEDNPLLTLTNAITRLSNATRCRPKDSGAVHTKVCEPNTFDSTDPKKLYVWKVGFSLSFLKGIALAWFKPNLLDTIPGADPAWADDYSEFVIKLTTNFGPHDPVGDAEHQLNNLQSGNSSSTTSLSSTGKKPQQPSSSSPKPSSDSSMPDLSGVLGKDGK
ncbi:hypothetical protein ID866_12406, partial [Astraeus odoratus]